MTKEGISKRRLSDLGYTAALGVKSAVELLQHRYMASDYHDSGHTNTAPTWIFKLPRYGNAEVGVRINKRDTTLYLRDRTYDGKRLRDLISYDKVAKVYPRDGQPAGSIQNSEYLEPSATNEVLMLKLELDDVAPVLAAFFGVGESPSALPPEDVPSAGSAPQKATQRVVPEEDFAALLERRSETGRAGEHMVVEDERERLRRSGCPEPERYVHRIAESDVGCGYDIESTWPGEERCIEVKTTSQPGSDFFLTANERTVLTGLGERAWLYRVVIHSEGQAAIQTRLRNPMQRIAKEDMIPVVWRVKASALPAED